MAVFINLTNHPSERWSDAQKDAAKRLVEGGQIVDLPFPQISPAASELEVLSLATTFVDEVEKHQIETGEIPVVCVQGEFTFVVAFVHEAAKRGIPCFAATSERNTVENADGTKTVRFEFVQFRQFTV